MQYLRKTKGKEKIDFKYNLSTYYSLAKKYRLAFLIVLLVVLASESFNVLTRFLFKIIIDRGTQLSQGTLLLANFIKVSVIIAIVFFVTIILQSALRWINMHVINRLEANLIIDLKRKFFNHILTLSYNFHATNKSGSLISRLIRGSAAIEKMTDVILFNTVPLFFEIIVVSVSLIYFSFQSSIVIVLVVLAFIIYSLIIQYLQQDANIMANKAEDIEKGNISDIFSNIDSIKYFGKESVIKRKYVKLSEQTKIATLKHWDFFKYLDAGQLFIIGIGTMLLVYFSILDFINKKISIGTLVFIYTTYGSLRGPLFSFVYGVRDFYRAMADFQDLFAYNKITNEIKDKSNAEDLEIKKGIIEFKDITFKYRNRVIFENFNLKINENEKIALIGHSGSGKTTLIKLLYRLYDVNNGEILIDNKNIKEFKQESLRSELSIVPQECILFNDTIYNNIAFSNPSASKEDILNAIKFAQLDKVIAEFPKKEKTIVGERGIKLSGGEKQRVSIARAILADKKVLVLDEATSSLDSETEHEIQKGLHQLMHGRTAILIAHRLSTIMKATKIILLDKGKIVQMGTHKELIMQKGLYRRLWNLQKKGFIKY